MGALGVAVRADKMIKREAQPTNKKEKTDSLNLLLKAVKIKSPHQPQKKSEELRS